MPSLTGNAGLRGTNEDDLFWRFRGGDRETVAVARSGDVPLHRTRARKPWASKAGRVGRRDGPGRWGDSSERRLEPELDVVCWPLVQRAAL